MSRIWMHRATWNSRMVVIHTHEPYWDRFWRSEGVESRTELCVALVERKLKLKVPKLLELIEVEITAKVKERWIPDESDRPSEGGGKE